MATADWGLDSERKPINQYNTANVRVVATHGDETVSGGTCKALGDAPSVGDDF